jgi:hypothetical protein
LAILAESCKMACGMKTQPKPKKLTKQEFLQRVLEGRLGADRALARLTEQLHEYERKYKLRSEVFYKLIVGTPAEDQPDFLAWAICYRSYFRAVQAQLAPELGVEALTQLSSPSPSPLPDAR